MAKPQYVAVIFENVGTDGHVPTTEKFSINGHGGYYATLHRNTFAAPRFKFVSVVAVEDGAEIVPNTQVLLGKAK